MASSNAPGKPLDAYPDAEPGSLPPTPPEGLEGEPRDAAKTLESASERPEAAALDFVQTGNVLRAVTLQYPFRREGEIVNAIPVKRLTLAEVGELAK